MDNKVYKKVLKFIKDNWLFFVTIILTYIILTINLPWSIYAPGGTIDVSKRLNGNPYKGKGSLNLTYVSFIEGTIPTALFSYIIPGWDLVSNSSITLDGESLEEGHKRDRIYLEESISNATYVAYNRAGADIVIKNTKPYIIYMAEDADTDLKIGDEVISYDDISFTSFQEMSEYVRSKDVDDTINFKVIRDKKEISCYAKLIEIDNSPRIGVSIANVLEFVTNPKIEYKSKTSESGASGGLMLSLALYNGLTEQDITKGLKISGTGTIDVEGNVGEIAGVKYKLKGAVKEKSDVFVVPSANYKEAMDIKKDKKYDIKIIEAKTFDQVLEELKSI